MVVKTEHVANQGDIRRRQPGFWDVLYNVVKAHEKMLDDGQERVEPVKISEKDQAAIIAKLVQDLKVIASEEES
jgi:hypothetical protein